MSNVAATHEGPVTCDNCATPLAGHYCHECGQTAHNPVRNFAHAVEEVFESFWHLDGRIFRTLRDILPPGRLASRYLGGHRAPYIAPLRLFVIVSVLTFFVARFAVSFGEPETGVDMQTGVEAAAQATGNPFRDADTVAQVIRDRDETIKTLEQSRDQAAGVPGMDVMIEQSIELLRRQARERIAQLDPAHPEAKAPESNVKVPIGDSLRVRAPGGEDGVIAQWVKKKGVHAEANLKRFNQNPELLKDAMLKSIPTALFFMVPVFALFLRLAYVETHRVYLEHLVVALYSHAWLCLALLVMCVLVMIDHAITPHAGWFGYVAGTLEFLLWWWMPIYLLLMQKRVYAQPWWLTVLKYLVIGTVYLFLVSMAAAFVAINSFISG